MRATAVLRRSSLSCMRTVRPRCRARRRPSPGRCRPASSARRTGVAEPAVVHDGDAVGQREDLVQVLADQQHAAPARAGVQQLLVHVGHRADVQAPGRLVGDDQRRCARRLPAYRRAGPARQGHQHAPEDQLLHVAARQRARRRLHAGDSVPRTSKRSISAARAAIADAAPHDAEAGEGGSVDSARAPRSPTAPGRRPRPRRGGPRGRGRRRLDAGARPRRQAPARTSRLPASSALQAEQQFGQRAWPLPATPAMATISPARSSQRHAVEQRPAAGRLPTVASRSSQHGGAGRARRGRVRHLHLAPHHRLGQQRLVGACRRQHGHQPPARSTAMRCDTRSTSSSLWLMKMIASPAFDQLAQRGEQRLALLRRQHRGRLVEDQDARAAVQRLQDLDPLALAHRQVADARVRVDGQAEALASVAAAPRAAARRENGRHSGSVPSITLSSTLRLSASVKCWCTMPMPAASAACGWPGGSGWPIDFDRSPRRPRSGRTGSTPACSCRRRSRPAAPAPRRAPGPARCRRWPAALPKRLVMPRRRSTVSPLTGLPSALRAPG